MSDLEVSGKRGISAFSFAVIARRRSVSRNSTINRNTAEVEPIANRYLDGIHHRKARPLDVVYTRFVSVARQVATVETCCRWAPRKHRPIKQSPKAVQTQYEFLPSAASILEEVVPDQFQGQVVQVLPGRGGQRTNRPHGGDEVGHGKRGDMIKSLSRTYNRHVSRRSRRNHGNYRRCRGTGIRGKRKGNFGGSLSSANDIEYSDSLRIRCYCPERATTELTWLTLSMPLRGETMGLHHNTLNTQSTAITER